MIFWYNLFCLENQYELHWQHHCSIDNECTWTSNTKKKKTYRKHSETNPAPLKSEPIVETVEISREKLFLFEDWQKTSDSAGLGEISGLKVKYQPVSVLWVIKTFQGQGKRCIFAKFWYAVCAAPRRKLLMENHLQPSTKG